jgi:hypothetical protein
VVSYYLLNDETRRGVAAGTSFLPFVHAVGDVGSRVVDPANPELAVAHPEELVRDLYAAGGLTIEEPIRRGRWSDGSAHHQDVITAVKP